MPTPFPTAHGAAVRRMAEDRKPFEPESAEPERLNLQDGADIPPAQVEEFAPTKGYTSTLATSAPTTARLPERASLHARTS